MRNGVWFGLLMAAAFSGVDVQGQTPAGSAFTYQGRLNSSGTGASGSHDFQFALYDSATGGNQVGPTVSLTTTVTGGLFAAPLDFGPTASSDNKRWLEIAVRPSGSGGYTVLSPRTELTAAPRAVRATDASNANKLGGVAAAS